jgi:hypothetical protein
VVHIKRDFPNNISILRWHQFIEILRIMTLKWWQKLFDLKKVQHPISCLFLKVNRKHNRNSVLLKYTEIEQYPEKPVEIEALVAFKLITNTYCLWNWSNVNGIICILFYKSICNKLCKKRVVVWSNDCYLFVPNLINCRYYVNLKMKKINFLVNIFTTRLGN